MSKGLAALLQVQYLPTLILLSILSLSRNKQQQQVFFDDLLSTKFCEIMFTNDDWQTVSVYSCCESGVQSDFVNAKQEESKWIKQRLPPLLTYAPSVRVLNIVTEILFPPLENSQMWGHKWDKGHFNCLQCLYPSHSLCLTLSPPPFGVSVSVCVIRLQGLEAPWVLIGLCLMLSDWWETCDSRTKTRPGCTRPPTTHTHTQTPTY